MKMVQHRILEDQSICRERATPISEMDRLIVERNSDEIEYSASFAESVRWGRLVKLKSISCMCAFAIKAS